ncbi:hypothetical protein WT81_32445 [Burkholderia stagnalis]|nr:hypothetical protein WK21_19755 [Burkholderia cepacia]KWK42835.1 hypothetical protein WT80_23905 [Burkholderia stagnalis]KWK48194.1 hypothetical protein WT81_32445 [Burkholderia stagnalis]
MTAGRAVIALTHSGVLFIEMVPSMSGERIERCCKFVVGGQQQGLDTRHKLSMCPVHALVTEFKLLSPGENRLYCLSVVRLHVCRLCQMLAVR